MGDSRDGQPMVVVAGPATTEYSADLLAQRIPGRALRTLDTATSLLGNDQIRIAVQRLDLLAATVETAARLVTSHAVRLATRDLPDAPVFDHLDRASATVSEDLLTLLDQQPEMAAQLTANLARHLLSWVLADIEEEHDGTTPQGVSTAELPGLIETYLREHRNVDQAIRALTRFYGADLATPYLDLLDLEHRAPKEIRQWLEHGGPLRRRVTETPALARDNYLTVLNALPYELLREALYKRLFRQVQDSPWPTALFERDGARGEAQLRPVAVDIQPELTQGQVAAWAQIMAKQWHELSDLDADALDALSAIWLSQARSINDDAVADVDDLLAMRGLKPKRGGQGRRGGYDPDQRAAMLKALSHIQNLWLSLADVEVIEEERGGRRGRRRVRQALQSRPFVITDRVGQVRLDGYMDVERFIFRPGKIFALFLFGPGRQTAMLSTRALQYDPYRHVWEKRLTRYLSYQWRVRASSGQYSQPYRISTLLEAVGEAVDTRNPARTRDRLEQALDNLQRDGVIAAWQYDRWDESLARRPKWLNFWVTATILIEPPDIIRDAYHRIERHETPVSRSTLAGLAALPDQLKQHRKHLGWSQLVAAEHLGIAQSHYNRIERGQSTPSPKLQKRIDEWLSQAG